MFAKSKRGVIVADAVIFLGAVVLFLQIGQFKAVSGPVGPEVYPRLTLILIMVLSLWDLIKEWRTSQLPKEDSSEETSEAPRNSSKQVVYLCVLLIAYLLLFEVLGFVIVTFLFIFLSLTILNVSTWWKKLLISTGFVVISYLVFVQLFHLVFPEGLLKYL